MSHPMSALRAIDHLVLPVVDLQTGRNRLNQLGFTVADDARHPFGTENACVFFADDTYLEPLAVGSREDCLEAQRNNNIFVARDQAFRFRRGEGLSAFVVKTDDAAADDARYRSEGQSAGQLLEFSRQFRFPDGRTAEGSFRLAFAADLRAPDFFAFACERVNPLPADRGALLLHANGAAGLRRIVLVEENPSDFQYLLELVLDQRDITAHSFGISVQTANASVDVLTPEGFAAQYGSTFALSERGLLGAAVAISVADLGVTEACLAAKGVHYHQTGARLVVAPEKGQGVTFAFEELK
ncbi:Glyoxalase-like domain-containing protein [Rhizobium sp. RU33A]|uniref:VOC family protein n=1 Tax=Rhizobium sp. RU33A TaxID=1907413 RepID=UPI0009556A0E|nr:VOC family protein [Rhizobium sp. RU33A]SIQ63712.1 Glyoxalase-like domain-containing protein [Rhizobium sp. RU33A]